MKNVLNLYAGLGGNRALWKRCRVTAVEHSPAIAKAYGEMYPEDTVIVCDAHEYLRVNFQGFDFIWSSPPCQTHSKMARASHVKYNKPTYADLSLYEEIIFLGLFFSGAYVVENVVPYYRPLIEPTQRVGRHLFWSNFNFSAKDVPRPPDFMKAKQETIKNWLGIQYKGNVYQGSNHCPAQVWRNCVHPQIGFEIFNQSEKL